MKIIKFLKHNKNYISKIETICKLKNIYCRYTIVKYNNTNIFMPNKRYKYNLYECEKINMFYNHLLQYNSSFIFNIILLNYSFNFHKNIIVIFGDLQLLIKYINNYNVKYYVFYNSKCIMLYINNFTKIFKKLMEELSLNI